MEGDQDCAEDRLTAPLSLGRTLHAKAIVSVALGGLGEIAVERDQLEMAAKQYREGLIQGWDGDYSVDIAWELVGLLRLASRQGRLTSVTRFVGGLDAFTGPARALPPAAITAFAAVGWDTVPSVLPSTITRRNVISGADS